MNSKITTKLFFPLLMLIGFLLLNNYSSAQTSAPDEFSMGKYFIIAIPDTTVANIADTNSKSGQTDEAAIYIYSQVNNKVKVITPGGGQVRNYQIDAKKFQQVDMMTGIAKVANPITILSGVKSMAALRVEAEFPVIVYVYVSTKHGSEMYTALPVEAWGFDYFAATTPSEVVVNTAFVTNPKDATTTIGFNLSGAPAEVLIMAAHDNTIVSFTPKCPLDPEPEEGYVITLNADEVFQFTAKVDTTISGFGGNAYDLAGTRITASKPVGVVSGNSRGRVFSDQAGATTGNSCKNLMIESLTPIDENGTKFVYMPTFDDKVPTGAALERGKRQNEIVRAYGTTPNKTTKVTIAPVNGTGSPQVLSVDYGSVTPLVAMNFIPTQARYMKTDLPSQLVMNSIGVYDGKQGARPPRGSTDPGSARKTQEADTRSPYSVNLVPREQWISFAPFVSPATSVGDYVHRINVVSDTSSNGKIKLDNGQIVLLNRVIPGTSLAWGSSVVNQGFHYVYSTNGAKFFAFAYGLAPGEEVYAPAGATGPGGGGATAPDEYDEFIALSYGYPLAPMRYAFRREDTLNKRFRDSTNLTYGDSLSKRMGDSIIFNDTMNCSELTTRMFVVNTGADLTYVGLRSIELINSVNSIVKFVNPSKLIDIPGSIEATIKVTPIDATKDASGTLLIKDRSGKVWKKPYLYQKVYVDFAPTKLDFGIVSYGQPSLAKDVIITNPLQKDVSVNSIKFRKANLGFKFVNLPTLPKVLKPAEQMVVQVIIDPAFQNKDLVDSIVIDGGCAIVSMPLTASTLRTCIFVEDLDFGPMQVGQTRNSYVRICCREGILRFDNPLITEIVTWLNKNFILNPVEIASLKTKVLQRDECFNLSVKFVATKPGEEITTIRVFSNANGCIKDTATIRAYVAEPGKAGPKISGHDFGQRWVVNTALCTKDSIQQYDTLIWIYNEGTAPFKVKLIELIGTDADNGIFVLGTGPSVTPGTEVFDGDPEATRRYLKILFKPIAEKKYKCTARLTTDSGVVKESVIEGEGIESHIDVTDLDFGKVQYKGVGYNEVVIVTAKPTRRLTITDVVILNNPDKVFSLAPGYVKPTKNKPIILEPGEIHNVAIQFKGRDAGKFTGTVCIVADHTTCEDSCGTLNAQISDTIDVPPAEYKFNITDLTYQPILTCLSDTNYVVVTNIGKTNVLVKNAVLASTKTEFVVDNSNLPKLLAPGVQVRIKVIFSPFSPGIYTDKLIVTVLDESGQKVVGSLNSNLVGTGVEVAATTSMKSNYDSKPWGNISIPISLDKSIDEAKLTSLTVKVNYELNTIVLTNGSEDRKNSLVENTILRGWDVNVKSDIKGVNGGQFEVVLSAPVGSGKFLEGSGQILDMDFGLFLGAKSTDKISYTVTPSGNNCIMFSGNTSLVSVDTVCGSRIRLIDITSSTYALKQNSPNPFNPTTDIEFSLGLDGQTRIEIYNMKGEKVTTVLDQFMNPGTYKVTWDATAFPSGMYYYRLSSGVWSETNTLILQK